MAERFNINLMDKDALGSLFPDIMEALASDGKYVFVCNIPKDISYWSQSAVDYFGLEGVQIEHAGEKWAEHIFPAERETYRGKINEVFSGRKDEFHMVYRAINKNGEYVTCTCNGRVVRDEYRLPKYFAGSIVNHQNVEIVDPVTGLFNRDALLREIEEIIRLRKSKYVLAIGVHNFFDVNNMYGYNFGNKVLKALAEHGQKMKTDGILFRPEGTKIFAMVDSERHSIKSQEDMFQGLSEYCKNELVVDGVHLSLDLCAVLMILDDFEIDGNSVYNNILYALDKAKRDNIQELFVVDSAMFNGNQKHLQVLADIRESIMDGFKGFYLCYQPIVDAYTENVTGMEALLRWKSASRGVVPPNEFIPWLEKDPVFCELGNWIIRQAIRDAKPILDLVPDFVVNVNLAYPQLQRNDFKMSLNRIVEEEGFPAGNLKLELTERCRLLDTDTLRNDMVFFKSTGMQTALDDFGTGYAALNLMTELPVDQIKIDKSFIDDIEKDAPKQSLLRALTGCATELGKTVCVEGIETSELAEYIRLNFKVSYFQGYHYSRPVPIEDFMDWIREKNGSVEAG